MDDVLVSIVCNAYNQELYIRDALDGFVMQKTSFPFEILIHDDASTDATAEIIREYAEKYPGLFQPILQTENQYSKGKSISKTFQFPRAKGKYIAFCEGDDYWTDPFKLQKQVDSLEQHPEIDICAHKMQINHNGKIKGEVPRKKENTIFTVDEVISGGGAFVMTASLMFRRELFSRGYEFMNLMSCDYVWQISGALRGGMLYLQDCMGVYRKQAQGSWSVSVKKNPAAYIRHWTQIQKVLRAMNEETNYRHASAIHAQDARMDLNVMIYFGRWWEMLSSDGRKLMSNLPPKQRVLVLLLAVRQNIFNLIAGMRGRKSG